MKKYVKSQTLWSDLNNTEKVAADAAAHEVKFKQTPVEEAVRKFVNYYNEGNAEPEYEHEDFFMEEADYNKVLDYVKRVTVTAASNARSKSVKAGADLHQEVLDELSDRYAYLADSLEFVSNHIGSYLNGGDIHRLYDILDLLEKNVAEARAIASDM